MTAERAERIRERLEAEFAPQHILVKDQSYLHAGHAGAQDGKGHFDVRIVAEAFRDKNRMQRHRMVYAALGELMEDEIHALSIRAQTPDEA